jgi:hypothetical protein
MVSSRKTATAKRIFERVEARRSAATAESGAAASGASFSVSACALRVWDSVGRVASPGFSEVGC